MACAVLLIAGLPALLSAKPLAIPTEDKGIASMHIQTIFEPEGKEHLVSSRAPPC